MTPSEFKKKLAKVSDLDWFKSKKEIFNFPYINVRQEITGVTAIYEFVHKQTKGWEKIPDEKIPPNLKSSKKYFIDLQKQLILFIDSFYNHLAPQLNQQWARSVQNHIRNIGASPFRYDVPETDFLLKIYESYPASAASAFALIINKFNQNHLTNKDNYIGSLLAYEFLLKDSTEITSRRNNEKSSLGKLRNDFDSYLSETEDTIVTHISETTKKFEDYSEKIDNLKEEKEIMFTSWFTDISKDIDDLKEEEETRFTDWFTQAKKDFNTFDTGSNTKIEELEKLYTEKLKLSAPAQYWATRAKKLQEQGWAALVLLVFLVIGVTFSLGLLLRTVPEEIYTSFFDEDKSAAIRWSIMYITFVSFLAYCIRAITKVMFSSFHLARDCQERNTLTYFYLALLKDTEITKEDRQLIMQSLFSRADTGLLKEDSSPSMPNDIVGKIFSK